METPGSLGLSLMESGTTTTFLASSAELVDDGAVLSLRDEAEAEVVCTSLSRLVELVAADATDVPKPGFDCGKEIKDEGSTSFCGRTESSSCNLEESEDSAFPKEIELVTGNGSFSP